MFEVHLWGMAGFDVEVVVGREGFEGRLVEIGVGLASEETPLPEPEVELADRVQVDGDQAVAGKVRARIGRGFAAEPGEPIRLDRSPLRAC